MAQSDYNLANQSGASFRAELNDIFSSVLSVNSGSSEPATRVAYMLWADTTSGQLKQRNAANNAWINKGALTATPLDGNGGTFTGDIIMSGASVVYAEGADVAAASTANIWATDGNTRHITGNTTITSFGTAPQAGMFMRLIFDGVPLLTQSANLNLNAGGSNIQIEAGDIAIVYADTTTQFDVFVIRKSGKPLSYERNILAESLLVDGAGGVGYEVGTGGQVTQATSKTTAVTLDKYTGRITMNGASLAANTIAQFTWNNSLLETGDVVVINHVGGGNVASYDVKISPISGSATVYLRNLTNGALADACVLGFAVIKGSLT